MHWWNDERAALAFAERPMPDGVRVLALTASGQPVEL